LVKKTPIILGMTYLVIVAFVAILGSLAAALFFMMRGSGPMDPDNPQEVSRSKPMAKALAFRVGFSVLLFLVVLFAYFMGWIQPTGVPM
jgi:hypothetical protein